jgi:hypothetical protein
MGEPLANACCAKPIATIIQVGDFLAGIVGLEKAIQNVYILRLTDEQQIKNDLLQRVRDFGNYVTPSTEEDYKRALFREYKLYLNAIEQATRGRAAELQKQPEKVQPAWKRWFHVRKRRPQ